MEWHGNSMMPFNSDKIKITAVKNIQELKILKWNIKFKSSNGTIFP